MPTAAPTNNTSARFPSPTTDQLDVIPKVIFPDDESTADSRTIVKFQIPPRFLQMRDDVRDDEQIKKDRQYLPVSTTTTSQMNYVQGVRNANRHIHTSHHIKNNTLQPHYHHHNYCRSRPQGETQTVVPTSTSWTVAAPTLSDDGQTIKWHRQYFDNLGGQDSFRTNGHGLAVNDSRYSSSVRDRASPTSTDHDKLLPEGRPPHTATLSQQPAMVMQQQMTNHIDLSNLYFEKPVSRNFMTADRPIGNDQTKNKPFYIPKSTASGASRVHTNGQVSIPARNDSSYYTGSQDASRWLHPNGQVYEQQGPTLGHHQDHTTSRNDRQYFSTVSNTVDQTMYAASRYNKNDPTSSSYTQNVAPKTCNISHVFAINSKQEARPFMSNHSTAIHSTIPGILRNQQQQKVGVGLKRMMFLPSHEEHQPKRPQQNLLQQHQYRPHSPIHTATSPPSPPPPPPPTHGFQKVKGFDKLDLLCTATLEIGKLHDNPTGCSCPKSKCVALYCDCFKAGRRCHIDRCSCIDCKNTIQESGIDGARTKAIRNILARNPRAFNTAGMGNPLHKLPKGEVACNCVRSKCLKLYCSCFHHGKVCRPDVCTCIGCENIDCDDNGNNNMNIDGNNNNNNSNSSMSSNRQAAIQQVLEKRSDAFIIKPKVLGKGCACKNNKCLRKYCECYRTGLQCNPNKCTCRDCENHGTGIILPSSVDLLGTMKI